MAYREDEDLEFLAQCSDEELEPLVYVLTHDPADGEVRLTEELLSNLNKNRSLQSQWTKIAGELQCFGADTWATLLRGGKGVVYEELLLDACEKLGLDRGDLEGEHIAKIERVYLHTILKRAFNKMNAEERQKFKEAIYGHIAYGEAPPSTEYLVHMLQDENLFLQIVMIGLQSITARAGVSLAAFGLRAIGAEMIGGVLAGPLGLVLAGSTVVSGAAFRVTIPACYVVAALRLNQLAKKRKGFM